MIHVMETLGDEILAKIFSFIPLSRSKVASQGVCRSWARTLLRPESHDPEHRASDKWVYTKPLPFKLLKVLPIAQNERRFEAGGHENILEIRELIQEFSNSEGIPAVMTSVKRIEWSMWNSSVLTRQRFPRLQSLILLERPDMYLPRVNLTDLTTLQWVRLDCLETVPDVELPENCKLDIVIHGQSELQMPQSVLHKITRLYWVPVWSNANFHIVDLSLLAERNQLKAIHLHIENYQHHENGSVFVIDLYSLGCMSNVRRVSCTRSGMAQIAFVCCSGWISGLNGEFIAHRS